MHFHHDFHYFIKCNNSSHNNKSFQVYLDQKSLDDTEILLFKDRSADFNHLKYNTI